MLEECDVAILGGGLAGLTLALQITQARPGTSIVVLEKHELPAPEAAHKVGESTVELGSHYLRVTLGLAEYLDEAHLPKMGLRFFLSPEHRGEINRRVEVGLRDFLPVPSHQLDRGILENELAKRVAAVGVKFVDGCKVTDIDIQAEGGHRVTVERGGEPGTIQARWVLDASGRAGLLKRTLGLRKDLAHDVNSVWFRLKDTIDVDDWTDDEAWKSRNEPDHRRLSTNHLLGTGYWVWLIPLVSGSTSVGIVADAKTHPVGGMNRFERAVDWLHANEPQVGEAVAARGELLQDFHVLRHYSHHCEQMFSGDRWGITGEAGTFLDPFYSNGTDFIGITNTFITDLVVRDLRGEGISRRAAEYSRAFLAVFDSWVPIFEGKYAAMGNTRVMVAKVIWDFSTYWAFFMPAFVNGAFTNLKVMTATRALWQRLTDTNREVQALLLRWAELDDGLGEDVSLDPMDVSFLRRFHEVMSDEVEDAELGRRLTANFAVLEGVVAELRRRIGERVPELAPSKTEAPASPDLVADFDRIWLTPVGATR